MPCFKLGATHWIEKGKRLKNRKTIDELERIFHPQGVAIVGASNSDGNLGGFFLNGFIQQGFDRGKLYVVHPSEQEVCGVKAYPRAQDIPGDVDLAVVFSPRETVPGVVRDCALKGIQGVVICTSGFGEKDSEGRRLEREIVEIARKNGTRLIGPNCVGIYCPLSNVVNFPGIMPKESGPVGMFSQSGSLSVVFPVAAAAQGIHFSKAISCGNECDINESDLLEYFGQDPDTSIIIAYMEGVVDGPRFYRLAREVSRKKPILLWKGGTSHVGSRAASSHTGALSGSAEVWNAVFKQTGIVKVDSAEEMLDCLQAFYFLPLPRGNRVAIVSGMGGMGVAIADACIDYGLELAQLSEHTRRRLDRVIPPVGTSTDNPVDVGMPSVFSPQLYIDSVEALAKDDQVDMLIITRGSGKSDYIEKVLEVVEGVGKPIALVATPLMRLLLGEPSPIRGIAVYPDGRRAAKVLGRMVAYQRFRSGE